MKETRAYDRLAKIYAKAHWTRIETWTTPGVFDSNACWLGHEIWVECKQTRRPKTSRGLLHFKVQQGQPVWEAEHRQAGGKTYLALMVDSDLFVLSGKFIRSIKEPVAEAWLMENALVPDENNRQDPYGLFTNEAKGAIGQPRI